MAKLTVIDAASKPNPLQPPASLGKAGAELWGSINRDYIIDDSGGREMLLRICEAADTLSVMDAEIERDGPTIRTASGLRREHPLLKHQLATRSFIVRSLLWLNLDVVAPRSELGLSIGVQIWL